MIKTPIASKEIWSFSWVLSASVRSTAYRKFSTALPDKPTRTTMKRNAIVTAIKAKVAATRLFFTKTKETQGLPPINETCQSLTDGNDETSSKDRHRATPYPCTHFICAQADLCRFILFVSFNRQVCNVQANNRDTRREEYRGQKQRTNLGPRSRPIHIQCCCWIDHWSVRRNSVGWVGVHFRNVSLRCVHGWKRGSISIVCMSVSVLSIEWILIGKWFPIHQILIIDKYLLVNRIGAASIDYLFRSIDLCA